MKNLISFIAILFFATSSFAGDVYNKDVENFISEWFEAQNTGSYSKYVAMYSKKFVGIRRSGSSTRNFNYEDWLKDRKKMFKKKMVVSGGVLEIKPSGSSATVKFEQTWESGSYKDKGLKLIKLALENGKLKIIREEMLSSRIVQTVDNDNSEITTITSGTTEDGVGKFTSIKQKDCRPPEGYFAEHYDFTEYTRECGGLQDWILFYVADGERSWFEIGKGKRLWSTQREVTGSGEEFNFGQAQDLGSLARVEWRSTDSSSPFALIFQVQALDPESTNEKTTLLHRYYVIGLQKGIPCFCGKFTSKEEARNVADKQTHCNNLEERKADK